MQRRSQNNYEHHQPENLLGQNADFFQALSICCPVGIFSTDTQGRCTYINPIAQSVCGFGVEEILGESWVQFLHPDERESTMTAWVERVFTEGEFCRECRFQSPQGAIRWVQVKSSQLRDRQGNLIGSVNTVEDITECQTALVECKQAQENQLQEQSKILEAILSASVDHIYIFDRTGRYRYISEGGAAVLGLQPKDFVGKTGRELSFPVDITEIIERFNTQIQTVISTEQPLRGETAYLATNGMHYYEYILTPLQHPDQGIEGAIAISRDITERKRAEAALQQSEQRLRLAQRAANVGTWEWNLQTNEVSWSEGIWRLLGLEHNCEQPGIKAWADFIHPGDRERTMQNVEAIFAQGEDYYDEFRIIRADGSIRWLASIGQVIRNPHRQVERFLGVNIDISDRKYAEEALETNLAQLEAVINSMTEGLVMVDPQGNVLMFNPAALAMHGFQSVEEVRQPVEFFANLFKVQELDGSPVALADWPISRALAGEVFSRRRLRLHRLDTGKRWVAEYGGTPVRNKTGDVILAIVTSGDVTLQYEAEEALRASEERFQAFMAHSPAAAWITDVNGRMIYLNPTYFRMFKFSESDVIGKSIFEIYDPEFAQQFFENIRTVARTNQVVEAIETAPRPDGTVGEFLVYKFPILNSSEQAMVGGVAIDITEQQAALRDRNNAQQEREQLLIREQAARVEAETAQEQITKILESITDGFIAFDREWRFTYVNYEGTRTLGRSRKELLGKNVWEEFPELAETSFGKLYKRAIAQEEPLELEDYYPPFDAWFSVRAYPFPGGLALYFLNISDRKRAEAKIAALNRDLQKRVDELQTLFEVIPIGILIAEDLEFKNVRANPAFAHILGIANGENASYTPPSGSSSLSYQVFRNGRKLAPAETPLRYAAIHGVEVEGAEVDILRHDGTLFNLYGYAAPLFDEQGKSRGAIGAFLDITERKVAEAEREQLLERERVARETAESANRVKDEFLAVLSHELRTPLNPILGWTRLLRTGKVDRQKTALALETIERNVKLQTQLIEDLLDVSRILQGKMTLNVCPVDLAVTIEAAKETVRLAAEAKSIQIQTELEPTSKQVMGDPNRLQQVVWNLLTNAVKFTPPGGQVHVKLEYVGTDAQITVKDTGKGISPEFLPYVFDTFRQADGTITRKFGGLGLGLAIVRHIVEMHGGSVRAQSPGEEQGAKFTVRLPLLSTTVQPNQNGNALQDSPNLSGIQILVVDDEPDSRELISFVLSTAGAQVTTAASAREALEILQKSRFDILVCDIAMPEMNGYMLIQQVRAWAVEQGGQIPAIALTAYAGELNRQQAIAAGFQHHISKPLEPEELIGAIALLLNIAVSSSYTGGTQ
jgi:PAS domain S-box-containing protein